jgi:hypothetical protein
VQLVALVTQATLEPSQAPPSWPSTQVHSEA